MLKVTLTTRITHMSYVIDGSLGILRHFFELSPNHFRLISFQAIVPKRDEIHFCIKTGLLQNFYTKPKVNHETRKDVEQHNFIENFVI